MDARNYSNAGDGNGQRGPCVGQHRSLNRP